jgi:hypothetical protein
MWAMERVHLSLEGCCGRGSLQFLTTWRPRVHPRRRYESDVTLLQKALNNEKFSPEILPCVPCLTLLDRYYAHPRDAASSD